MQIFHNNNGILFSRINIVINWRNLPIPDFMIELSASFEFKLRRVLKLTTKKAFIAHYHLYNLGRCLSYFFFKSSTTESHRNRRTLVQSHAWYAVCLHDESDERRDYSVLLSNGNSRPRFILCYFQLVCFSERLHYSSSW